MTTEATQEDHHEAHGHRHMLWMMLACLAVGVAGYFVGGLDYLWVALMGSCLLMHVVHTVQKRKRVSHSDG